MTILASFCAGLDTRVGVVTGPTIIDVNATYRALLQDRGTPGARQLADAAVPTSMLAYLQAGDIAVQATAEAVGYIESLPAGQARFRLLAFAEAEVQLEVPIADPPKIVCVARNYGKHAAEAGKELSEIPILFPRFAATLVRDGGNVVVPHVSPQLDWEGELAVVIGKGGRYISAEDAMDYVAGYSIFNDVTVRDYQFRVTQYTGGKNFHASGPFGPHLVLKDEITDPHALQITTRLNGRIVQDGNTSEMIFDIPTIIEHISEFIQLEPGDVIPMGTPAGVGFTRTPPLFLKPGDTIDVTIDGLGTLSNPVTAEVA